MGTAPVETPLICASDVLKVSAVSRTASTMACRGSCRLFQGLPTTIRTSHASSASHVNCSA